MSELFLSTQRRRSASSGLGVSVNVLEGEWWACGLLGGLGSSWEHSWRVNKDDSFVAIVDFTSHSQPTGHDDVFTVNWLDE